MKSENLKIAICNRGEVAVRIIHAIRELGGKSVLLHSEADLGSLAYRMADECFSLGGVSSNESYLNIDRNIAQAKKAGVQGIHPGFGFLSENAEFAKAAHEAGIVFIGPRSETINDLGDKTRAKKLCAQLGIPTVPGFFIESGKNISDRLISARKRLSEVGFPCVIKASAGGGGRGMKVVSREEDFEQAFFSATREAQSAFGSDEVFVERYLQAPKHIEVQIMGDGEGRVVHLFERECSIQRRHQKVIEEAPSAKLPQAMRVKIIQAAQHLAETLRYLGAGTVEFMVEGEEFYFLEVNTRLQVEHPVTEWICGVDLVKGQIQTAFPKIFSRWSGFDRKLSVAGHALECRVYAEDPYKNGLPSLGKILGQSFPFAPGRRFDWGYESGDTLTEHYDSMLGKVIVWDETRRGAIQKMLATLSETIIFGIKTNIPFLKEILRHQEFQSGDMTTQFLASYFPKGLSPESEVLSEKEYSVALALDRELIEERKNYSNDPFGKPWRLL